MTKMSNQITYGGRFFGDDAIKSISLHLASGLISSQLEADTLTAVVKTEDKSIMKFKRNTPLKFRHTESQLRVLGDKKMRVVIDKSGRAILARKNKTDSALPALFQGTFYLQSVYRTGQNYYTLSATSAIGILMERPHVGGVYNGQAAESVIQEICGNIPVLVKSHLKRVPLYGWLPYAKPPQSSARDNLCQVLFALGASIRADADGVLRIFNLWTGESGAAPEGRMYQGSGVEYFGDVSSVSVSEHQYFEGGDEETLFDGMSFQGDTIFFREPMYDLRATGFSILSSGANYAVLSQGDGILTGRKYLHNTREISRIVAPNTAENVKNVSDATLISPNNSVFVAERLANYYKVQKSIRCGIVLKQQLPGDIVQAFNPYDSIYTNGCIESMDVSVSAILRADMRILDGYNQISDVNIGYFNKREIITTSDFVEIPNGTKFIHIVLIGGGYAGEEGKNGERGQRGGSAELSGTRGDSIGKNGLPGKGGAGGKGGSGGKVLVSDIEDPPTTLYVEIGSGEVVSWKPGTDPPPFIPDTVLFKADGFFAKMLSSEDGDYLENGYRDPITGEIYAIPGLDGIKGGDGGEAGGIEIIPGGGVFDDSTKPVPGEDGENVGEFKGGAGNKDYSHLRTTSKTEYGATSRAVVFQLPGGGGGAAFGVNGRDANSDKESDRFGEGGSGMPPVPPPERDRTPGCGGDGGNGGGGGGAGGSAYIGIRSSGWGPPSVSEKQDGMWGGNSAQGTHGTNGMNGCAIFYFYKSEKSKTGAIMDAKKRIVLDKFGRLIVV